MQPTIRWVIQDLRDVALLTYLYQPEYSTGTEHTLKRQ